MEFGVFHDILIVAVFIVSQNKLLKNLFKIMLKICAYFTLINLHKCADVSCFIQCCLLLVLIITL